MRISKEGIVDVRARSFPLKQGKPEGAVRRRQILPAHAVQARPSRLLRGAARQAWQKKTANPEIGGFQTI
jgi:hypothetical protein